MTKRLDHQTLYFLCELLNDVEERLERNDSLDKETAEREQHCIDKLWEHVEELKTFKGWEAVEA